MTKLSVNINKLATLRNSRGGNNPNIENSTRDCESFGAQGITVHPRPDERHITMSDVYLLKNVVTTEFNIEGYPDDRFMAMVEEVKPTQATLVPDSPDAITSNAGWNTVVYEDFLKEKIEEIKGYGVRVSVFVDPDIEKVKGARKVGADRVELFTEPYAVNFRKNKKMAISPYVYAANHAVDLGMEVNAGHDLDLHNLGYFKERIPFVSEVSIGHALICDALYLGLNNSIQAYLRLLED